MKIRTLTIALACVSQPVGSMPGSTPQALSLDRLYSLPRIIGTAPSGVVWAGDSRSLAFLWNDEGTNFRDVWMVGVDGGAPVRITAFPRPQLVDAGIDVAALRSNARAELDAGVSSVAWFPDSEHLLATFRGQFYRVAPGREPVALEIGGRQAQFSPDGSLLGFVRSGDLWVAPVTAGSIGTARTLTDMAGDGVGVARYAWSPDGERAAVLERDSSGVRARSIPDYLGEKTSVNDVRRALPGEEPGRTRLEVVDIADGSSRRMLIGDDDRDLLFSLSWAPDGQRLLVDKSDLYVKDRRVLSVDARTGLATLLYREQEPHNVMASWSAAWAPDGAGAYVISDRDDFYHLYSVQPGADPRPVTAGDWAVESFRVTNDAIHFVANREHPAERHIYRVPLQGGAMERLSKLAGTHAPTYSPDGRWAAVQFSSDDTPPDLFLNRLDVLGETRVTWNQAADSRRRP